MSAIERISSLIGVESIKNEISGWVALAQNEHLKNHTISHNYLIPLESGAGRTTIAKGMVGALKELHLFDFTSATSFLEFKLSDRVGQAKWVFEQIRAEAIITNEFHGAVGVDISAYSEKLRDTEFSEFLDLVEINNDNIIFFFFIQRQPLEKLEKMLGRLQASGNTKLLQLEQVSEVELLGFMQMMFKQNNIVMDAACVPVLQNLLKNVQRTSGFTYFKSVQKLVADLVYSVGSNEKSSFSKNGVISNYDLLEYTSNDFTKNLLPVSESKRMGF